ncbi:DUF4328 domain-containing protein [Terrabacter sp. NPDC080008]|uniref:DUF4328 domain-containing protein n=1 Tax=Terrabacter sp. NPDC080008 TaxID=3155176 RepID=UPI00344C3A17
MSHQPPERPAVPTAPAHVPYALISRPPTVATPAPAQRPSGLTADGNVVRVQPWRGSTPVLARAAQGLLVLLAFGSLPLALLESRVDRLLAGREPAQVDLVEAVGLVRIAEDLTWVRSRVAVVTAVVLLVWLHQVWTSDRSAHNVYTRGTSLAVGGWLIPVANLVLAPNALRDLWHGTERARDGIFDGPVDRSTPRLVSAWWVAWCLLFVGLVGGWLTGVGADLTTRGDLVTVLRAGLRFDIFTCVAFLASGVLLACIVGRITSFTRR